MEGESSRILCHLREAQPKVVELLQLWQGRRENHPDWQLPETYWRLAKFFIDLGVPFTAREVAEAGRALVGESKIFRERLRHVHALALVRSGMLDEAARVLQEDPLPHGTEDEELLGAEAAIQKQIGLRSASSSVRDFHLRRALDSYAAAWRSPRGSYWTGINVATLHRLLGDAAAAAAAARQVEVDCLEDDRRRSNRTDDDPYWRLATLGEACLNQGRIAEAEAWYRQAVNAARGRIGHLNSTRRQLRLLLEVIGQEQRIDDWLPIPGIAVFTGHRIDGPGRETPRFSPAREQAVKSRLIAWLNACRIRACVCSAAQGADILFLEALQSLEGCDTRIVLPFSEEAFIRESVANGPDESWVPRFRAVLAKASRVTVASPDRVGQDGTPFAYANQVILGQGLMLADELQTSICGLAVWRPDSEAFAFVNQPPLGGASDAVAHWQRCGIAVHVLDPSRDEPPILVSVPATPIDARWNDETPVMAMVFADVVGYSRLADCEVALFADEFLGRVAECVAGYAGASQRPDEWLATPIPARKTWGDGLYFAFRDLRVAGQFALDLCDQVRNTRWRELGFSTALQIRIALHAGPVHLGRDPVTGLPECSGAHVSRAARLEPKTPPNRVYASDAFAALAAGLKITEFVCEYVKLLDWAKHYGSYPTYAVRRNEPRGGRPADDV